MKRRPRYLHPDDPRGSSTPAPKPLTPAARRKHFARFNRALPALKAKVLARPDFDERFALDSLTERAEEIVKALDASYIELKDYYADAEACPNCPRQ